MRASGAVLFVALTTSVVSVYGFVIGRALPPLRNEPASFLLLPVSAICGIAASVLYPVLLHQRSRVRRVLWMYVGFLLVLVVYGLYLWRVIPDGTAGLIVLALVAGHLYGLPALLTVFLATTILDRTLFRGPLSRVD
jgi:hypothetical protein